VCRTKRCSEREPADSLRDKFNVIGGWLPPLTFALGRTGHSMSDSHMNERPASNPSPVPGSSTSACPQSTNRPYRRALLLAFVACFLWPPLTILLQKGLAFSNGTVSMLNLILIVAASAILYRSRLQEKSRAARAGVALLISVALFGVSMVVWVVLFLLLLKCTGASPFPM
jgi:hypothetical protein